MIPSQRVVSRFSARADINVTPLVDVMLVLLIIFMVTAPMMATGMKLALPQATNVEPLAPREPIVIALARDGALSIGGTAATMEGLADALRAQLGADVARPIHLRADRAAPYGDFVVILDALASQGFKNIAILTDRRAGRAEEKPAASREAAP